MLLKKNLCLVLLFSCLAFGQEAFAASVESTGDDDSGSASFYLTSRFEKASGDLENASKNLQKVYKKNPKDSDIASQDRKSVV